MTTQRFYPLLASAVLSLLLASATAAHASNIQSHVNGPNVMFIGFCTPAGGGTCADVSVFTNTRTTGQPSTLSVFYDFFQNGVFNEGFGTIPGSALQATGNSATLNLDISALTNECIALSVPPPCTPLSSGSITLTWKVNGLSTLDVAGTTTDTLAGVRMTTAGHLVSQQATVTGTMLGINVDADFGSLGRTDNAMLTITTTK